MSAAIVQKNSTTTSTTTTSGLFFACGDIFNLTSTDKPTHGDHVNIVSKLSTVVDKECNGVLESKDKLEKPKENGYHRYHNALTRTISQPPQTLTQQSSNVSPLVTPLIENFGNINLHRKLERTQSEPLPQQVNTSRYKTELCRPFEEAGECKYGEKCQFAHGYHELRNLQRHPKYKTEYCRTFHSVGFCPYGPRCHFVHNADEARASQQQQQQQQQPQQQQQQQPQQQQPQQQTKLQNSHHHHGGNNFNNCLTNFGVPSSMVNGGQQQQQQSNNINISTINLGLPLSPPLSMSTGSDRESPTGSLSLSPTNSMTNFPFGDQLSSGNSAFQTPFPSYVNTPPESPNAPISPVNTPPPSVAAVGIVAAQTAQHQYIKPTIIPNKQALQKSSSSPIAIAKTVGNKTLFKMNSVSSLNGDDARLPVFNRLSAAIENCSNMAL